MKPACENHLTDMPLGVIENVPHVGFAHTLARIKRRCSRPETKTEAAKEKFDREFMGIQRHRRRIWALGGERAASANNALRN